MTDEAFFSDDGKYPRRDRFRVSRTTVLACSGVVLALVVGGLIWWKWFSGPSESERTEQLADSIKQSLQHHFDTDEPFVHYGMRVGRVVLVKKAGNEYDGLALVTVGGHGTEHRVPVQVTADEDGSGIWHTDRSAFLFLLQEQPLTPTAVPVG